MSTGKKTATPAAGRETTTDTKKEPGGTAAPVTDPLDLWYLCEKVGYALNNPKIRSDGQPMYQRVVTQLIRLDDEMFSYHFPYIGEVGYDMTQNPPKPVMSRMRPNYPSTFPLSKYAAIKRGHQWRVRGLAGSDIAVELVSELMSLEELESTLTPEMRQGAGKVKPLPDELSRIYNKRQGLFRIPDVVRLKNRMLIGKQAFSQSNLHTVIEIKFPGDKLTEEQQQAYEDIAGAENFRLLETDTCRVDDKTQREWLRDAKKEPVYLPVGLAGARNRLCLRPELEAYPLLEGLIAREHQQVKDYFVPYYPPLNAGPRLEPMPDPALAAAQEQQQRKARAQLELALGGPFFAIAAGVAGGGAVTAAGGSAAVAAGSAASGGESLLLGRAAGQVVSYVRNML
ncbi:VRR-NUC domain-containing protein, partial [Brenneria populi]|nr:VRR-NUC domain-containing protein [Brenneria populi Li et al. 2015]